jgi:hypothetical protein
VAELSEASELNDRILAAGVVVLVDLEGNRLRFYPREASLPKSLWEEFANDDRKKLLLRNFLINLGRL